MHKVVLNNGVEMPKPTAHSGDGKHARIGHPAKPARLDGERRQVDGDDFMTTLLEMQSHSTGSTADVQHPAANVPHGAALMGQPLFERSKVGRSACGGAKPAIVAFNDLGRRNAPIMVIDQPTVSILFRR